MLYHVSESAGIALFKPRPSEYAADPVVWAIEEARLCNYLLPRDCPRVTFYAGVAAAATDVEGLLGASSAVVAIETGWFARAQSTRLFCYEMPPKTFECLDRGAGYFVSRDAVVPSGVRLIDNPVAELRRLAELRTVTSLWPLRDAVVASSLQFSLIRMRNAAPRPAA
jgi:hypothetical protein